MRNAFWCVLALGLLAGCQGPSSTAPAVGPPQPRPFVLGYVDCWNPQGAVNAHAYAASMSALSVSSRYWLTADGEVKEASDSPVQPGALVAQAHRDGLKVYPGVSNNDGAWQAAFAYGAAVNHRAATVANLTKFVVEGGWDGLEVDFEYADPQDPGPSAAEFTAFITALGAGLRAANPGYQLIVSVPAPSSWVAGFFDDRALAQVVDYLQVMTYDQNGPGWASPGFNGGVAPGPVAGLDWMDSQLRDLVQFRGIPGAKILSGLPAYGQDYSQDPDSGATTVFWRDFASVAASHPGAEVHRGRAGEGPTPWISWGSVTYGPGGPPNPVLWYDDAPSLEAKAGLVAVYGLAGTSVWAIGQEDGDFWNAVDRGLGQGSPGPAQALGVARTPTTRR